MSVLMTEELKPFAQIKKSHPNLSHVSPRSLSRWWRIGTVMPDGTKVRLEAMRVGGRTMTSLAAVDRYLNRTNAETAEEATPLRSPAERQRASEAAAAELQNAGA